MLNPKYAELLRLEDEITYHESLIAEAALFNDTATIKACEKIIAECENRRKLLC